MPVTLPALEVACGDIQNADRFHYADVVILTAMGEEAAVDAKEAPRQ
jgi:hypothetical protein